MPGSGTSTFIDPDDYQASVHRARLDLLVIAPGTFKARLTWATLHHLHLLRSEEDLPRIAYLSLAPALVFVAFATGSDPAMLWGGMELQIGDIILHSRGEISSADDGPLQLEFCRAGSRAPRKICWSSLRKGPLPPGCRPNSATRRTRRSAAAASACAGLPPRRDKAQTPGHPEVARAIEQDLILALVTCLTAAKVVEDGAARRHHTRIMVRFEEVLADHPNRQLHLPELCALIGVSERTLRSCCAEFLGISPSRYMLLRRLQAARIALRDADPTAANVAEIARGCGFTEFGRFAVAYRTAFGEPPSTTLRRAPGLGIFRTTFADSA